jgi:hypothetical protein
MTAQTALGGRASAFDARAQSLLEGSIGALKSAAQPTLPAGLPPAGKTPQGPLKEDKGGQFSMDL